MDKKNLLVLFGGKSPEYYVSRESAASVLQSLDTEKYNVITVGITPDKGKWFLYTGSIEKIEDDTWYNNEECTEIFLPIGHYGDIAEVATGKVIGHADIVFPVLHGKYGEDGCIQALLEQVPVPYVGCKVLASAACMDKVVTHIIAEAYGVKGPKFIMWTKDIPLNNREYRGEILADIGYPVVIKPANAGSSVGITKVDSEEKLTEALELAFEYDDKVLVQEFVDGFEVGCALLGNDINDIIVGGPDEIELINPSGIFDYNDKYDINNARTTKIHLPARIDEDLALRIKILAKKAYIALGCTGFARVDLFVTKEGEILLNEINTIPGCTSVSRWPSMLSPKGYQKKDYTFSELLDELIKLAEK